MQKWTLFRNTIGISIFHFLQQLCNSTKHIYLKHLWSISFWFTCIFSLYAVIHWLCKFATFSLGSVLQLLVSNLKKYPCKTRGYLDLAMAVRLHLIEINYLPLLNLNNLFVSETCAKFWAIDLQTKFFSFSHCSKKNPKIVSETSTVFSNWRRQWIAGFTFISVKKPGSLLTQIT